MSTKMSEKKKVGSFVTVPKGGPKKGKIPGGNMACCYGRGIMPDPGSQKKGSF